MRKFALVLLAALLGMCLPAFSTKAHAAQISVQVGSAPECPYGYYDVAPYECAPAGYYGPEWFDNGVFVGVGPWFHGPADFRGHVDNRFHKDHGYKGELPKRGERPDESKRVTAQNFHGNEVRDGRGHTVEEKK